MNSARLTLLPLVPLLLCACPSNTISVLETTGGGSTMPTGDGTTGNETQGNETTGEDEPDACVQALDILMVVDNSGSMGEEQVALVDALSTLLSTLDLNAVDWRIGVTTSDNSNPWCPPGATTPEGGELVASSCTTRLDDFVFNNGEIDVRDEACADICGLASVEIAPSSTEVEPNPAPRPWIESIGGQANVDDPLAALSCILPQGVNGCGFESQLESSYLSLARMQNANEDSYGFLRSEASLLLLFVTDEADCSYNPTYASIFESDGNKVFWSDPAAAFPSSAVCWNAGVTCTGDPSAYTSCDPVNKDVDGNEAVADDLAVLRPMARYHDVLASLEDQKRQLDPQARVRAALIAGTELGGSITYSATDPGSVQAFGVDPGCQGAGLDEAIPPVRMRDLAEQSGGALTSICAPDLSANMVAALTPFLGGC